MKIITNATLKGGSGKTINAFNIGGILAETKKVLLIDADPQCNLSNNCDVDLNIPDSQTIRSIFERPSMQPDVEDIIYKNPIKELPNLDIIPSSILLFRTEKNLVSRSNREKILDSYIEKNIDVFEQYDYILIDTNPSMSAVNINSFFVADKILLSSDISINSINGAELFITLWADEREDLHKEDNVAALIVCNSNSRTNVAKEFMLYATDASFSKDLILNTTIPQTIKIKDAELAHKPINILYPHDKITKLYRNLVDELYEREVL